MRIAGIDFCITGEPGPHLDLVRALWQDLFAIEESSSGSQPVAVSIIDITNAELPELCPVANAVPLISTDAISVHMAERVFWMSSKGMACSMRPDRLVFGLTNEFWERSLHEQRDSFLTALAVQLRQKHVFGLHGNALEKDGTGILIIGDSGAGKTTLTLALIRNGWDYLSDDAVALVHNAARVEARALRRGFSLTQESIERSKAGPDKALVSALQPMGTGKFLVMPDEVIDGHFKQTCVPAGLFFCQVGRDEKSRLEPVDSTTAFSLCMRQAAGLLADRDLTRVHMDLLRDLVQQSVCYRVITGKDVVSGATQTSNLLYEAATRAG